MTASRRSLSWLSLAERSLPQGLPELGDAPTSLLAARPEVGRAQDTLGVRLIRALSARGIVVWHGAYGPARPPRHHVTRRGGWRVLRAERGRTPGRPSGGAEAVRPAARHRGRAAYLGDLRGARGRSLPGVGPAGPMGLLADCSAEPADRCRPRWLLADPSAQADPSPSAQADPSARADFHRPPAGRCQFPARLASTSAAGFGWTSQRRWLPSSVRTSKGLSGVSASASRIMRSCTAGGMLASAARRT